MADDAQIRRAFDTEGRVWFRGALSEDDLVCFEAVVDLGATPGTKVEVGDAFRARLADGAVLRAIAVLGSAAQPVDLRSYHSSPDRRWGTPWFQLRMVAFAERHDVEGYRRWSPRNGVWHCEPPREVMDAMFCVRVYLDDIDAECGAMSIAVGSHVEGLVPAPLVEQTAGRYPMERCTAARGDVLVTKMLTLHEALPSRAIDPKRVFRIDFSTFDLPAPLAWAPL